MPPSRKPIIHNPSHNAPVSYLPYKLRSSSHKSGVGHIRAGDLAAQALPPRAPAELFAAALLDGDMLGFDTLQGPPSRTSLSILVSRNFRYVFQVYRVSFIVG